MIRIILAALIAASPAPSSTPQPVGTATPRFVVTYPTRPAPQYTPIPCNQVIDAAKLARARENPDTVGRLLATALRLHGYEAGLVPSQAFGRAVVDLTACRIFKREPPR